MKSTNFEINLSKTISVLEQLLINTGFCHLQDVASAMKL